MKLFDLTGKVAIVTGGNGGIGLGMARGLAQAGATIVVAARNAQKSATAVAELKGFGAESAFLPVDVEKEPSCRALVAVAVERFGRLDILVNNAGTAIRRRPEDLSLEEWTHVIDTNLTGAFLCAQAAYPEMKKVGGGKIINVASGMAFFAAPFAVAYCSSKGGMVQLGRALATAWAADNIQVNNVLPGWTETEFTEAPRSNMAGFTERVIARTPAGRWGAPDDFAGIAVFLASSASNFITGGCFAVDGGYTVTA
jgi:2-deoxy-D-gluconate 3-dehydrogenase